MKSSLLPGWTIENGTFAGNALANLDYESRTLTLNLNHEFLRAAYDAGTTTAQQVFFTACIFAGIAEAPEDVRRRFLDAIKKLPCKQSEILAKRLAAAVDAVGSIFTSEGE